MDDLNALEEQLDNSEVVKAHVKIIKFNIREPAIVSKKIEYVQYKKKIYGPT